MMDIPTHLDEHEALPDLIQNNIDFLKKDIVRNGISEKRPKSKTTDLLVRAIAKHARSKLP